MIQEPLASCRGAQQRAEILRRKDRIAAIEPSEVLALFAVLEVDAQGVDLAELHGQQAEALNPVQVRQGMSAAVDGVNEPRELKPVLAATRLPTP